jgi:opacity protein-like surface antigen
MKQYGTRISWLILLLLSGVAQAQEHVEKPGRFGVGGSLGLNLSTVDGQHADRFFQPVNRVGLAIGGLASVRLHDWVGVQLELVYSSKGTGRERDGMDVGPFISKYVDVPLLVHARIPLQRRIQPYALAGARLSALLDARVEYTDGTTVDVKDITTSLDYGLLVGAGAGFDLSAKGALQVEIRYDLG